LGKGVALERGEQGRGNQARGDGAVGGTVMLGGNSWCCGASGCFGLLGLLLEEERSNSLLFLTLSN